MGNVRQYYRPSSRVTRPFVHFMSCNFFPPHLSRLVGPEVERSCSGGVGAFAFLE
jgi:hypothetical protein